MLFRSARGLSGHTSPYGECARSDGSNTPDSTRTTVSLFDSESKWAHFEGNIFKFYLEPLTSFWQAQDDATRRIQGARGLAVGDRPPIPSWVYMGRTTGSGPARKMKTCGARRYIVIVPNWILYL